VVEPCSQARASYKILECLIRQRESVVSPKTCLRKTLPKDPVFDKLPATFLNLLLFFLGEGIQVSITDGCVEVFLRALQSDQAEDAWKSFLITYSELIFGVIRSIAQDPDSSGDCFVFVCGRLADKNYRRLRSFRQDGRARFSTWLRAVVRNLCLDWYRAKFGRKQMFRFLTSRSVLDQQIFQAAFQRGMNPEEVRRELSGKGYDLSFPDVERCIEELRNLMSARQLWLLSVGKISTNSLDSTADDSGAPEIVDPAPNPEMIAILRENRATLSEAFARISSGDQLLLRLRYVEGLGLQEVADLVGLKDPQTADRRIRGAIEHLRERVERKNLLLRKTEIRIRIVSQDKSKRC